MTAAVADTSTPLVSWWYGQNRAVDTTRRLETLLALNPSPGPVGAITVRQGELTAAFLTGLNAPLPHPWQPAGRQASIPWESVNPGTEPDPEHPVLLVALGTGENPGALFVLNLAAFSRIRVIGDPDIAQAVTSRWVLELLSTHPATTIGITDDVWPGPFTSRVWQVTAGNVPDVDVLILGGGYSYADRSQIVTTATSRVLVDLGQDAAVSTTWTLTCGANLQGELSNGLQSSMKAELIVPARDALELCRGLMTSTPAAAAAQRITSVPDTATHDDVSEDDVDPAAEAPPPWDVELDEGDLAAGQPWVAPPFPEDLLFGDTTDFSAAGAEEPATSADLDDQAEVMPTPAPVEPDPTPAVADLTLQGEDSEVYETGDPEIRSEYAELGPSVASTPPAHDISAEPAATSPATPAPAVPASPVASPRRVVIWNRILGKVTLSPPHGGPEHPRDKRLNELTVYLQTQRTAKRSEIVEAIFGGVAEDQTVTGQLSVLRKRLGRVHPDGDEAFPKQGVDGYYSLHRLVISDWMEFDRLTGIDPNDADPSDLVAAMELVTGPPLGTIRDDEWLWSKFLRDDMKTRVPDGAVSLARHYFDSHNYSAAVDVARKGLWYDSARNDLWAVALRSAAASRNDDQFRELRSEYKAKVPEEVRKSAGLDLT